MRWLSGLFRKNNKNREVTFDEWIDLLRQTSLEGFDSEAYARLKLKFPIGAINFSKADGNRSLVKEMNHYASTRLSEILEQFQSEIEESLLENDESRLERAFRILKSSLKELMFFETLRDFPRDVTIELSNSIEEAVFKWETEYRAVLRENFETAPAGSLGEELLWMYTTNLPSDMLKSNEKRTEYYA